MTFHQIIGFFITFKYLAIFPIAVVEGPIITIISGFLVSLGNFSLLPALLIVFLGDVVSDFIFYFMGRGGRHAIHYFKFKHLSEEKIEQLEKRFELSPWKTMIIAKISYGLGGAFMAGSGALRISWKRFLEYILVLDFIRSSILLAIGFYFGKAAVHLGPTYLKYYALIAVILVPIGYLIYYKKTKLENILHWIFEFSIGIKFFNGVWETISGFLILFFGFNFLFEFLQNFLKNLSHNTEIFIVIYLLIHGFLNLFLAIQLFRNKIWAYLANIFVTVVFLSYQIHRIFIHHSPVLTVITIFDILFIMLTWHEYKRKKL